MSDPLRLGVIGAGNIAQVAHLPAAGITGAVDVVALCDQRGELLRLVADRFGIAHTDNTAQRLLAEEAIEAVDLCVPTIAHDDLAGAAFAAGKHVLCEKPMASTLARARRMLAASERAGRRLMIGHHKRYDPGCEQARDTLVKGDIGQPRLVIYHFGTGNWTTPAPFPPIATGEPVQPWEYEYPPGIDDERHRAYYVSALEMFTHITNLVRWLVGDPDWVIGAQHADGVVRGTLTLGWGDDGSEMQAFCVDGPHYQSNAWNEVLTVWGDQGRLEITLPQNVYVNKPARVRVFDAGSGADTLLPEVYGWAFARELEHFAHCLRSGEDFRTSAQDSLRDIAIAETATMATAGLKPLPVRIDYDVAGDSA